MGDDFPTEDDDGTPDYLPFGKYPRLSSTVVKEPPKNQSLGQEVENLGAQMKQTVKDFASYRNMTCLGDPCELQAFPIVYSKIDSGFFGGARFRFSNISRRNPAFFNIEGYVIRSDSQQWLNSLTFDFPLIEAIPLHPRIRVRTSYSRSTEVRYFGTNHSFIKNVNSVPDEDVRYSLKERGFTTGVVIPLFRVGPQNVNFASSFTTIEHRPASFESRPTSKLFEDSPEGINGGASTRIGLGMIIDSRDRDVLTQNGWELEAFYENAGPPFGRYKFKRITVIDRRYASQGRFTLANRISIDSLWGDIPFWELRGIGGFDAISDVSSSTILRGFPNGRFHEKVKIIESAELRYQLNTRRVLGIVTDTSLMPVGLNVARLGDHNALGLSTGAQLLFNKGLLVQLFFAGSRDDRSLHLSFGQDF